MLHILYINIVYVSFWLLRTHPIWLNIYTHIREGKRETKNGVTGFSYLKLLSLLCWRYLTPLFTHQKDEVMVVVVGRNKCWLRDWGANSKFVVDNDDDGNGNSNNGVCMCADADADADFNAADGGVLFICCCASVSFFAYRPRPWNGFSVVCVNNKAAHKRVNTKWYQFSQ